MNSKNLCFAIIAATIFTFSFIFYEIFQRNYNYNWKVNVTYTNGENDTISFNRNSFKGNECYLKLKISENGVFSSGGTEPCLITICGIYETPIVCGVRKYTILSFEKKLLK